MSKITSPYKLWESPITDEMVASSSERFGKLLAHKNSLYFTKSTISKSQKARMGLFKITGTEQNLITDHNQLKSIEILPDEYQPKSKVHEYGGGEIWAGDDKIFFVNASDQQIYSLDISDDDNPAKPSINQITNIRNMRFSDGVFDKKHNQIICVSEFHHDISKFKNNYASVENSLVAVSLDKNNLGELTTLANDADFYSSPRLSHLSDKLAFISWDLPFMPFESSDLNISTIADDGSLSNNLSLKKRLNDDSQLADSSVNELFSFSEPAWQGDKIYFVCDINGWNNIYCTNVDDGEISYINNIYKIAADFAKPAWIFAIKSYHILSNGDILASYLHDGRHKLGVIKNDAELAELAELPTIYDHFDYLDVIESSNKTEIFLIAGSYKSDLDLVKLSFDQSDHNEGQVSEIAQFGFMDKILDGYISKPELLKFSTSDNQQAYGLFFKPTNKAYETEDNPQPPLIIALHGGPTGTANRYLMLKIQYWTSRGFAYLDLDYRGSYGYGKEYRDSIYSKWGDIETDDIYFAIKHLTKENKINKDKIFIKGGSAGGYSVLCALVKYDIICAGSSHFGVADMANLLKITHKFEAGYLVSLIAGFKNALSYIDNKFDPSDILTEKSQINHIDKITTPIIFFQGGQDFVVPPSQSENIYKKLKAKGINTQYHLFKDEGHGFRNPNNIKATSQLEYDFFVSYLQD